MEDDAFLLAFLVFFLKCACYSCLCGGLGDLMRASSTRWRLHSVLSELEPLWLCWSAEAALAEVGTGLAFSLKSVIITVRSPTVTSRCRALLLSMFFNLGLPKKRGKKTTELEKWQTPVSRGDGRRQYLIFLPLFLLSATSFSLLSDLSFFSFLWGGGANCWFTCCATSWETGRGFLKETKRERWSV